MKKILIINGHPDKESFNYALAEAHKSGLAKSNASISEINIADLDFNPNLKFGYRKRTELEPDLLESINKIKDADHIVWIFPVWWYGYPAIMKGFIDRVFLPGIAFEYIEGKALPKPLFIGKTARLIITGDTPKWYDFLIMKNPVVHALKKGTLQYCGIKEIKVSYVGPIISSTQSYRAESLNKVKLLGENL